MVKDRQTVADNAADEEKALADAKSATMTAAEDARTAADAAAVAAAKVAELAGEGSAAATRAQILADEAEDAAVAAETANTNAQADTTSTDAVQERMKAVDGRNTAQTNLATLEGMRDDAQVAYDATQLQLEARDLADAKKEAQEVADEVNTHYMEAKSKAQLARGQATAARAAARRASGSRTDYENADKYAKMAEAEATTAEAAAMRAMQANARAMIANMAAQAAETSAVAKAELDKLKAENVIATEAHTGDTGAGMAYMAAKDAAEKAADASTVHVLSLLQIANADHITGAAAKKAHLNAVRAVIDAEGDSDLDADTSPNAGGESGIPANGIIWRYHGDLGTDGLPGGDGENGDTKPGAGKIAITVDAFIDVDPDGDGSETADDDVVLVHDDPDTVGRDESNFVQGEGVGDFLEFHISESTQDVDGLPRTRVLVFTDKEQAAPPIPASTVRFTNQIPVASRVTNLDSGVDGDNNPILTGLYDHDGDSRTGAVAVTFACPTGTPCSANEDANGVITISGYRISTAPGGVDVEAVSETEDNSYIAFGVWLSESEDGTPADGVRTYAFGAFQGGGSALTGTDLDTAVTGTATYSGSAAGLHSMPGAVNFFHADATLTANFGAANALGKISGEIHNIVSGGERVSDSIYLDASSVARAAQTDDPVVAPRDNNITAAGAMDGRARMGSPVIDAEDGTVSYPYNGTWSGQFYNDPTDIAATAVNEAEGAPGSVAGTFGVSHTDGCRSRIDIRFHL